MNNPRFLGERELALIEFYVNYQPKLSPQDFYSKWAINYEQIGYICSRSPKTVQRWFSNSRSYRAPNACDLHHLGLMDFLLEHFEEIPSKLLDLLHPSNRQEENASQEDKRIT
ncbi:MAG: helix-turn-helix domain-containing protein [Phormidium sp.]